MGADFGVGSYCFESWDLYALGYPEQALDAVEQALSLAQRLNHPLTEAFAQVAATMTHLFRGEPQLARKHAESCTSIATDKDLVQYIYWARIQLHSVNLQLGEADFESGVTSIREAIEACRSIGAYLFDPFWLGLLAQAYSQQGKTEQGLSTVDEALAEIAKTGEELSLAELYRLKGQLLLESNSANTLEAESCFLEGIKIARSQNARGWELRNATYLAKLWVGQNKKDEAHQLLAPIFDWFTEGFETTDLREAKTVLDGLSSVSTLKNASS